MDAEFWLQRWSKSEIGFHQSSVNPWLEAYWPTLPVSTGEAVLVPLSGKSLDMIWLERAGFQVIGCELSEIAVRDFLAENERSFQVEPLGALQRFRSGDVTLLQGDFFQVEAADLGKITGVYDRAALVALPPALRRNYVKRLRALVPDGVPLLLITMEYDQESMSGPPFCVMEDEVRDLFDGCEVVLLQRQDILAGNPRFVERGLQSLYECAYRIVLHPEH